MTSISQQAGRAPDRHRARRSAARPAGHAVRFELAGGHAPLRHQQAGRQRLLRARSTPKSARRKAVSESYDVSGWVNLPVSDNFALRAVGFWSEEGGYVDNVLGPDADGRRDERGHRRRQPERLPHDGGRLAGLGRSTRNGTCSLTGIYQRGDTKGTWDTDPFLGDNKSRASSTSGATTSGTRRAATLKGDLGFAELSLTASYFNRKINYEWDNTNYAQWRAPILLRRRTTPSMTPARCIGDDLQLPEAESLVLRSPADLEGRQQAEVDGGRLLRGRVRLVGVRRDRRRA